MSSLWLPFATRNRYTQQIPSSDRLPLTPQAKMTKSHAGVSFFRVPLYSFQGSFFLENLWKPREIGRFLERMMVEKNGTSKPFCGAPKKKQGALISATATQWIPASTARNPVASPWFPAKQPGKWIRQPGKWIPCRKTPREPTRRQPGIFSGWEQGRLALATSKVVGGHESPLPFA